MHRWLSSKPCSTGLVSFLIIQAWNQDQHHHTICFKQSLQLSYQRIFSFIAESAQEVIQVNCPDHGSSKLLLLQVLDLTQTSNDSVEFPQYLSPRVTTQTLKSATHWIMIHHNTSMQECPNSETNALWNSHLIFTTCMSLLIYLFNKKPLYWIKAHSSSRRRVKLQIALKR